MVFLDLGWLMAGCGVPASEQSQKLMMIVFRASENVGLKKTLLVFGRG